MKYISVFILILLLGINKPIVAQETNDTSKSSYWINAGIGGCYFGPTFNFGLSYSFNNNIISARYLKADEARFFGSPGGGNPFDNPALRLKEIGILYGRSSRTRNILLSLSIGLGYIDATNRGKKLAEKEYDSQSISTLCFPMELKFRIEFTDYLGLGCTCFGNINNRKSFVGGSVDLHIGKF